MKKYTSSTLEVDNRAAITQVFSRSEIRIICCRYWWLKHWEITIMDRPFWRVYYNPKPGAYILYQEEKIPLETDRLYVIPPDTPFSATMLNRPFPTNAFVSDWGRITHGNEKSYMEDQHSIIHLFIHFNLSEIIDKVAQKVYAFELDDSTTQRINLICNSAKSDSSHFDLQTTLAINSIIAEFLCQIPKEDWQIISTDTRILATIHHIRTSLHQDLSNQQLAQKVNLTPHSFCRLFKQKTGISPQSFVRKEKVNRACDLLHHSDLSIEQIAYACGFNNRFYFTKIFTETVNMPPARYKKNFTI